LAAVQGFEIGVDGGMVRVGSKGKAVSPVVDEDDVHDLLSFMWGLPSKMTDVWVAGVEFVLVHLKGEGDLGYFD
jgi:hypothetical protein